jgi:pyruvate formate lyase activating enzyme
MEFLRAGCSGCGRCAEACPSGALSSAGREETAENVVKEVLKDRRFYEESGGGITLSGGECLLQPDFAAEILKRCAEENVHTAVETALFTDFGAVEKTLPFCRLYLADLKIPDPEKHKRYTGQDNRRIVANLRSLAERAPGKVLVRIPLIPGVNDTDIPGFAELLSPLAGALRGAEVLRYNSLAGSKYEVCGREYRDFGESQTGEEMALFCSRLQDALGGGMPVFTSV